MRRVIRLLKIIEQNEIHCRVPKLTHDRIARTVRAMRLACETIANELPDDAEKGRRNATWMSRDHVVAFLALGLLGLRGHDQDMHVLERAQDLTAELVRLLEKVTGILW